MQILFLNHNVARRGGTFYRAYHVARYLVRRGHSVMLLTISANRLWGLNREMSEGVEIIHTPDLLWGLGRSGWDPWDTLNRIAYLRGKEWDIIHAWDSRPVVILPALYAREQSKRISGKLVMDWCDWFGRGGTQSERVNKLLWLIAPIETFFEEGFRTQANGSTVISRALFDRAVRLGVPANTIHILRQGCEVETSPIENRTAARQRLGLPADLTLVGFLGTLNSSDASLLLDTFRILFQKCSNCKGVMIGNHRLRIPPDLRQSGRLIETGFVQERILHDYLASCDVFLSPLGDTIASQARWPSKVNLFLSAGKVTIMTRAGDLAQILESEGAGVVANCNAEDIAEKTLNVLNDSSLRVSVETRARRLAEGMLSWNHVVDRLEDFYAQLRPNAHEESTLGVGLRSSN